MQNNIMLYAISILLFYLPIGRAMEQTWGDFKYNLYLFTGFILTIAGAFLCYLGYALSGNVPMSIAGIFIGIHTISYYFTMSIFFAYAGTYPDATVLFMFIIPVKIKWLGILNGALFAYQMIDGIRNGAWPLVVSIAASFITFAVFFLADRKSGYSRGMSKHSREQAKRRREFHQNVQKAQQAKKMMAPGQPIHKCAVCGRTELDDPGLEFRYCSKCYGSYEYCQDHLFTHVHVK
jgi:hypothetical protein